MPTTAPTLMEMLAGVIADPSVSSVSPQFDSGNRAVSERLANWLDDLGFRVELMEIPGHTEKYNVIAALGEGDDGLVLAGHSDTVPFDLERWSSDPFTLTERDGRLYGLGTCDMKGFFPLAIEAARRFKREALRAPLTIVATADEESTMDGALELVKQGRPKGRYALIGEPTGLRPVRAHKGIMMEAIRLIGRAGHSSDPALGINALEGMHQVLAELIAWREELQANNRNPLFAVPVPTLNLGHIHGGDNPNRICGQCELHIDIRPLPGMALEELRGELERRVRARLGESALAVEFQPLFSGTPAMETRADSPIVTASEALTHHPAGSVAFGTEGPYFHQLGVETVILGPGDIEQAHQPDEYLEMARIAPTVELLEGLIRRFCVEA